jgi:hypothetical protein
MIRVSIFLAFVVGGNFFINAAKSQGITFNEFARYQYFDAHNGVTINQYAKTKLTLANYTGPVEIQYGDGSWIQRNAKIAPNPTDPNDNAMQFTINSPNCCNGNLGRVQMNLYKVQHLKKMKVSVDVFIPQSQAIIADFPSAMNFLTISEWWNNEGWGDQYPFRISVNVVKDTDQIGSPLVLEARAQIKNETKSQAWQGAVWLEKNSTFHIPFNKWFTLEYEFVEGDDRHGKFILNSLIDNKKYNIFNVTNFTHHPDDPSPDGLTAFNPIKLYTNQKLIDHLVKRLEPLTIYWDNLHLSE